MNLIEVSDLETKLGKSLGDETSPKWQQAHQAIWTVSTRALAIAETDWTPETVPAIVRAHIIEATYRLYRNPNRYLTNTAVGLSATLAPTELNGDIFLAAERADLEAYAPNHSVWTQPVTRHTNNNGRSGPCVWRDRPGLTDPKPFTFT